MYILLILITQLIIVDHVKTLMVNILKDTMMPMVSWDVEQEEWYFSVVDVVLTDSPDHNTGRKYWNKLKQRLKEEGSELVTNCHQLKM